MLIIEAIKILNLNNKYNIQNINNLQLKELKKQYHDMALSFHPDKQINNLQDNNFDYNGKFQKINEAYVKLKHFIEIKKQEKDNNYQEDFEDNKEKDTYIDLILRFMNINVKNQDEEIVNKFKQDCQEYRNTLLFTFIRQFNVDILEDIYKVIINYKHDNISQDIKDGIHDIIKEKLDDYNIIILTPTLKNLFNSDLFKLEFEETMEDNRVNYLYIPLWHSEINYKKNIIKIQPDISNNILIDDNNNIIFNYKSYYKTIIEKLNNNERNLNILLENKVIEVPIDNLYFRNNQKIVLKNQGIPKIDIKNIYNNKEKSDIIITITLE